MKNINDIKMCETHQEEYVKYLAQKIEITPIVNEILSQNMILITYHSLK